MLFDRISLLSYPSSRLGTALTLARLLTHDRRGPGKPAVSERRALCVGAVHLNFQSICDRTRGPKTSRAKGEDVGLRKGVGSNIYTVCGLDAATSRCVAVPGRLRRRSRPAQRRRRRRPVSARSRAGRAASCPGTQPSASCAMAKAWRRRGPVGTSRRVRRRSWPWRLVCSLTRRSYSVAAGGRRACRRGCAEGQRLLA